ncbi:hypothetical protein STVA_18760 [Allostella vacuolata]|nr:hypothetical protein STVA_18760 [Stella vacuolata]
MLPEAALAGDPRQITIDQRPLLDLRPPASALSISAWVNRADATYRPGDDVTIYLRANLDARITILNVDATGRTTVLLPNSNAAENRISANAVHVVPPAGSAYALKVRPPFGANVIKIIATTSSVPVIALGRTTAGEPFSVIGDPAADVARRIEATMGQQRTSAWAMAELPIFVVEERAAATAAPAPTNPPAPAAATPSAASAFGLDVRTSKFAYRVGEELSLLVTPEKNCNLTLVGIDPENRATVLFPNALEQEVRLDAGRARFLPGSDSRVRLSIMGPPGRHTLHALCRPRETVLGGLFDFTRAVYPMVGSGADFAQLLESQKIGQMPDVASTKVSFEIVQ